MIYAKKQKTCLTRFAEAKTRRAGRQGFTLLEVLVSIAVFSLVMLTVYSLFSMAQTTYSQGGNDMELWQNARASLDRMTRELRQAEEIVTVLPATNEDPINPPASELEFKDGHDITQITYIRYYLDGTDLKRRRLAYYFASDPAIYVYAGSVDESDNPPLQLILEDRIIGEYFSNLDFWEVNNLTSIYIQLRKTTRNIELMTAVYGRNL